MASWYEHDVELPKVASNVCANWKFTNSKL